MLNSLLANAGTTVLSIFLAIIILLAMITIHEFGHYLAGRILGFKINEFSIGFGPAVFRHVNKKSGVRERTSRTTGKKRIKVTSTKLKTEKPLQPKTER